MQSARTLSRCCYALLLALLVGCGGGKYQPVSGEIVFPDGTAVQGLTGGQVVFQKVAGAGAEVTTESNSASGSIDENGKFQLGTEQVGDGAVVGEYQAVITPPQPSGDEILPKIIDDKFTKFGGFKENYTVKPGSNHFKLEVEPFKN